MPAESEIFSYSSSDGSVKLTLEVDEDMIRDLTEGERLAYILILETFALLLRANLAHADDFKGMGLTQINLLSITRQNLEELAAELALKLNSGRAAKP